MRFLLMPILALAVTPAFSSDYVRGSQGLYEKVSVPYSYYYCNRPYTGYKYEYRLVVNKNDTNWKEKVIDLLEKKQEYDSFERTIMLIAPEVTQSLGSYGQQAAVYPTETGNTLGAFSNYEYRRYGPAPIAYDPNMADERNAQGLDQLARLQSEISLRTGVTLEGIKDVYRENAQSIAAQGEWERATEALREIRALRNETVLGEVATLREMKPQPRESLSINSGTQSSVGVRATQQLSIQQQAPADVYAPVEPPQVAVGLQQQFETINTQFCASCHGASLTEPKGGFYLDWAVPITKEQYVEMSIRNDLDCQEFRSDGKTPFRMPPKGTQQPSEQQREVLNKAARFLLSK